MGLYRLKVSVANPWEEQKDWSILFQDVVYRLIHEATEV